jgi:hypothetical protein
VREEKKIEMGSGPRFTQGKGSRVRQSRYGLDWMGLAGSKNLTCAAGHTTGSGSTRACAAWREEGGGFETKIRIRLGVTLLPCSGKNDFDHLIDCVCVSWPFASPGRGIPRSRA